MKIVHCLLSSFMFCTLTCCNVCNTNTSVVCKIKITYLLTYLLHNFELCVHLARVLCKSAQKLNELKETVISVMLSFRAKPKKTSYHVYDKSV